MLDIEIGDILIHYEQVMFVKRIEQMGEVENRKKKYKLIRVFLWNSFEKQTVAQSLEHINTQLKTGTYKIIKRKHHV